MSDLAMAALGASALALAACVGVIWLNERLRRLEKLAAPPKRTRKRRTAAPETGA